MGSSYAVSKPWSFINTQGGEPVTSGDKGQQQGFGGHRRGAILAGV